MRLPRSKTWRPRTRLVLFIFIAGVLGLAVAAAAVWDPEPINWEWAESTRSQAFNDCPEGRICVEWCRISQGHIVEATGRLCCGTPGMVGSTNPGCPG